KSKPDFANRPVGVLVRAETHMETQYQAPSHACKQPQILMCFCHSERSRGTSCFFNRGLPATAGKLRITRIFASEFPETDQQRLLAFKHTPIILVLFGKTKSRHVS